MASKRCIQCGAIFQYDPLTEEDNDFCSICLFDSVFRNTNNMPPEQRKMHIEAALRQLTPQQRQRVKEELTARQESQRLTTARNEISTASRQPAPPRQPTARRQPTAPPYQPPPPPRQAVREQVNPAPTELEMERDYAPRNTARHDDDDGDIASLTALVGKKLARKGVKTLDKTVKYIDQSDVVNEFRKTDFTSEIISHDADSVRKMLNSSTFWIAMFVGVLPLLITTFTSGINALYGLLIFFAVVWAVLFKSFILDSSASLKYPITAFFFTGVVGISWLLTYHEFLPAFYLNMHASSSHLWSLAGWILQTGLNEEICKLLPVVMYLIWKRKAWSVEEVIMTGIFSGLGFAAFENMHYSIKFATASAAGVLDSTRGAAAVGTYLNTISSMTYIIVRSLSCLFAHAVWTGIATCFVVIGLLVPKRRSVQFFLALAVPAVIHGCYNWLAGRVPFGSALITAAGFALFFGYLIRTRKLATDNGM